MPMRTLLCLQDQAPFIAPKADVCDLAFLAEILEDYDAPPLPEDFAAFLEQANGFIWNGIEIFGSDHIVLERDRSVVPALTEINESYHTDFDQMQGRLVIGRSEDDLYVYDEEETLYLILDRQGFEIIFRFTAFADLLRHIIDERK
ncbi:MAG: hypothetical protein JXQ84_05980 [Rhodospirillaceae bacterium]|nr:hypothetical protein [Rhodospirillaceae bacterium]